MATPNIVPRADSEGGLGTASKYWASAYIDLIYVGAGKIGRDADNLIDFSTDDKIQFEVAGSIRSQMTSANFFPNTNDGLALGAASYGFSDLFLASGAVINFDNSNVTLTHSSNALTLADDDQLNLGTGNDLQLYHNGTHSYIGNYVGDLILFNHTNDGDIIFQCDDGNNGVTAYLTLDGSAGHITVQQKMLFGDGVAIELGNQSDSKFYHDGSNGYIENHTGNLNIFNHADDADLVFGSDNGSSGVAEYFRLDGSSVRTIISKDFNFIDSTKALLMIYEYTTMVVIVI